MQNFEAGQFQKRPQGLRVAWNQGSDFPVPSLQITSASPCNAAPSRQQVMSQLGLFGYKQQYDPGQLKENKIK